MPAVAKAWSNEPVTPMVPLCEYGSTDAAERSGCVPKSPVQVTVLPGVMRTSDGAYVNPWEPPKSIWAASAGGASSASRTGAPGEHGEARRSHERPYAAAPAEVQERAGAPSVRCICTDASSVADAGPR